MTRLARAGVACDRSSKKLVCSDALHIDSAIIETVPAHILDEEQTEPHAISPLQPS